MWPYHFFNLIRINSIIHIHNAHSFNNACTQAQTLTFASPFFFLLQLPNFLDRISVIHVETKRRESYGKGARAKFLAGPVKKRAQLGLGFQRRPARCWRLMNLLGGYKFPVNRQAVNIFFFCELAHALVLRLNLAMFALCALLFAVSMASSLTGRGTPNR